MANPRIEVEIGGKVDPSLKGSVTTASNNIERLGQNASEAAPQINKLTRATSGYNGVGIEFARIIQDAPFGVIGIGNNITRLSEVFTQARQSGQSFGKILGGIFSAGNALTLGISILTSAFTYLSIKGFFDTEKSAKSAEEALEDYRKTLGAVTRLTIEGAAAGQKEVQSLALLRAQAESTNVPLTKRLQAVRDLKKEFPDYLQGLTDEQILTGNVGVAYDNLTKSIIATAKARAFSDQIAKNSLAQLTLEQQQIERVAEIEEKRAKITRLQANTAAQALRVQGQFTAQNTELVQAESELGELIQSQLSGREEINKINSDNLKLEQGINSQLSEGASFTNTIVEKAKELKRVYEDISKLPLADRRDSNAAIQAGFEAPISATSGRAETQGITIPVKVDEFKAALNEIDDAFESFGGSFLSTFQQFATNVNAIIRDNLTGAFTDFGFSIGEALSEGTNVIDTIGRSLLQSMARFLGDFGQQLIAVGVAGLAFTSLLEAIKAGGPLGIPASIAAIAAGTALTIAAGALQGIAGKGLGGGGSSGAIGGSGGTFTGSGANSFDPFKTFKIEVVGEISGDAIGFALKQSGEKKN